MRPSASPTHYGRVRPTGARERSGVERQARGPVRICTSRRADTPPVTLSCGELARTKNTRYLPRPSSRPGSGRTVNVTVPSFPVARCSIGATREYGTPSRKTRASRTTKPRVSLTRTVKVKGERELSTAGFELTLSMVRRLGSATDETGIERTPPGRLTMPAGRAAIFAFGAVVAVVEPLLLVAVTTAR